MNYAETIAANQQYLNNVNSGNAAANKASGTDSGSAASAQDKLSGDLNFFLRLLTTQLKNQDPTQPLDTNQVTQQIATLSSVQQQVNTNSNLEKLLTASKQSQLTTAVSYIGKEVETPGNTGEVMSGQGAFAYSLASTALKANVTIKDAGGNTVFTGTGTTNAGRNIIVWDGTNSITGAHMPDGTYTLSVSATDTSGKAVAVTTASVGIVTSVQNDSSGNLTVNTGKTLRNFADVVAVRNPSRIVTTTASTGTNSASN